MNDSYIEENDKKYFDKGLAQVRWRYEHGISFVTRNQFSCLFNGLKSFEYYYGIGTSFSENNVSIYPLKSAYPGNYEHTFGVDYPKIDLPPVKILLRDIAKTLNKIASQIEGNA